MGLIAMSERDLQRIEVLSKVMSGRVTVVSAAHVLDLSERHVRRLLDRMRTDGAASIRHKAIGRPSNNRISDGVREYAMMLVRQHYSDFGPTLATEKLAERDGLHVSRETVRRWMADAGLWLSAKQRRTFHQPRLRREAYGDLIQIDGSEHRWFEDRGPPCSLLVFVDDATGKLMQLRFVRSESTFTYFEALELYLKRHGAPIAFYVITSCVESRASRMNDVTEVQRMPPFSMNGIPAREFEPGQQLISLLLCAAQTLAVTPSPGQ